MSDYDDLFKKHDGNFNLSPKKPDEEVAYVDQDYFFSPKQQRTNLFLFFTYVLIMVVFVLGEHFLVPVFYPADTYKSNMEIISGPTFNVTSSGDTTNPYRFNVSVSILNKNPITMAKMYFKLQIYDANHKVIGTYYDEKANIASGTTFDASGYVDLPIDSSHATYSYDYGFDYPTLLMTGIQFGQVFLTAIAYLFLDWGSYKCDLKRFKKNFGTNFVDIIVGFGLVWFVMYVAQIILSYLGVTGTSKNEMAIRSMFDKNLLNLTLLFLILCILTPLVEETLFRKVLYNFIQKKTNNLWAIILSGLVFGMMHVIMYGDFIQAIPYVAMGTALGYIYYLAKKNIFVTMSVHFLNNLISFLYYVALVFAVIH